MRPFKPEHYFRAALERMEQARVHYHQGTSYALCMYVAGVAVECMLRAFKGKRDPTFDEKHDLQRLFQASGMLDLSQPTQEIHLGYRGELQAAVNRICVLWSNDYRFASEERLRTHLRKMKLHQGIKGDFLKENARRLLDACRSFIAKGILLWDS